MNAHAQLPADQEAGVDSLLADIVRLEALIGGWDESQRGVAFAYRQAIDALHKAALRGLLARVKTAPAALDALRLAAADPLVYTVLRYHGLVQPSQQERIELALASVRPMLASHGGDVELVAFVAPDTVEVRFVGNCDGCSASTLTFVAGVKRAIEEHCPEIKQVRQVKSGHAASAQTHFVSPFAGSEKALWSFALDLSEVPDGGIKRSTLQGEALLFSRLGRAVACFRDSCAHLGMPISSGAIAEGRIICPHHGFEYDLMSGECITAPEVQLRFVPIRLVGDRVEIRIEA
jgi:Fe-S cluster biogenesis protein NfuA/nitrite reductase/ring-hydroxylating ferredoxin subunit